MDARQECLVCGANDKNADGNCGHPAPDGQWVQCVGTWSEEKHHYVRQYFDATREVRNKYLPPDGRGGACFVDLFAGPGCMRVRDTGIIHDGSPMIAAHHDAAPFTDLIFCDYSPANAASLRARMSGHAARVAVLEGDCNGLIEQVVSSVPVHGLNIALIDPFALAGLKFATVRELASVKRMDLIIHFPMGETKRNLSHIESCKTDMDEALGTERWRSVVHGPGDAARLIDVFREQLQGLGYTGENVRSQPIKNNHNLLLYYLVYASKHARGDKIWQSITKTTAYGQRGLPGIG